MLRKRSWIPVSLALALLTFLGLSAMGAAAPAPPDPPDPPTPALAPPAPPAPPVIRVWDADDLGDLDDGPMAFMGADELAGIGPDLMAMASGYGGGFTRGEMAKTLKLTDDQKNKIDALTDKQRRSSIQARADLEISQMDMAKLMRADNPDRSAIESQIDKISNQRAEMRKAQVRTMLDVRAVLTPQQRDQLKAEREKMRAEMHNRFRGGMGRHRGMDGGRGPSPGDTQ